MLKQVDCDWMWIFPAVYGNKGLPLMQGSRFFWNPTDIADGASLLPQQLVPTEWKPGPANAQHCRLDVTAVTLNVQSLQGKHRYLEDQLVAKDIRIAALQETKDKGGYIESKEFLRVASDSDAHWGTAVWIRRKLTVNAKEVPVDRTNVAVICREPRMTLLVLTVEGVKLVIGSCHIPHQARGVAEREELLEKLGAAITKFCNICGFLLGIDANARVPDYVGNATGDLAYGVPDAAGEAFAERIHRWGLQLPSTFRGVHSGDSYTWRHACGNYSRIDYFAVGGHATFDAVRTRILHDVDTLSQAEDHWPLQIQTNVAWYVSEAADHRLHRPRYDVEKMSTEEGKSLLRDIAAACPRPHWNVHVDQHAEVLAEHIRAGLQEHFPLRSHGPRAQYISSEVWRAREKRRQLKQRTRRLNDGFKGFVTEVAFQTWKWGVGTFSGVQWKVMVLRELVASAIKFNICWAKQRIKEDKRDYLRRFLRDLGGLNGTQLQQKLSKCGLGARSRRKGRAVVPAVHDAHGCLLVGRQQQDEAWMGYFGAMEGGSTRPTVDFLCDRRNDGPCEAMVDFELDATVCPRLWELEAAYLTVPTGKTAGLDSLPPELFRHAANSMAELYFPLVLKCTTKVMQPLQWTGGILFEAFKNSGLQTAMESYRSLYVASIPGKLFHRVMRQKFAGGASSHLHGLHCGARAGCSVTTPSLALHLMTRLAKDRALSAATLFLDTKTAYYAVARELATGPIHEDAFTEALFYKFRLSGEDLAELLQLVRDGGTFREAGASEHLLELVKSIYRNGWFVTRFTSGRTLCVTTKGSRPGSCWADLVFTFIYARVLAKVRLVAECEDFSLKVQWSGVRELWTAPKERHQTALCLDATWADDTAAMTTAKSAQELVVNARAMASELLDVCRQFGLQPNFKKGKTMMVFSFRGKGSKKVAAEEFAGNSDVFHVPSKDGIGYEIHAAAGYVHLGTYLDKNGHMECEARRRTGIAAASFEQSRKIIFQNQHIDLASRAALFTGIVGASLFNLELWTPKLRGWSVLKRGFQRLQRRLLVHTVMSERLFRLTEHEVTFITSQADLDTLARRKRIGFLVSMVKHGCDEIWALAQAEQQWATQVREDLTWLRTWTDVSWPQADSASWPGWWHLLREKGNWVKRQAKLAQRRYLEHTWRRTALRMFLYDAANILKGSAWRTLELYPEDTFWCMQCRQRFINKAGLSVHFFKKHGRKAAYRQYVHGTLCRACGMDFHSAKRLAMHLRASTRCRGVLAAMGLRSDEWDYGLCRGKRLGSDEPILCPPEKKAAPSDVQPLEQTAWEEFPILTEARSALMDWLIEYEGEERAEVREGLLRAISRFPVHAFEARMIFAGLTDDVVHIIEVEKLHVWMGVGQDVVCAITRELALTFRLEWFAEGGGCARETTEEVCDLLLRESFWCSEASETGIGPQAPTVLIVDQHCEKVETLQQSEPSVTNDCSRRSLACSKSNGQTPDGDVQVTGMDPAKRMVCTVAKWQEGTSYLLTRLDLVVPLDNRHGADVCKGLLRLLSAKVQGRAVALQACASFWTSDWSLPFRALFLSRPLHSS